MFVQILSVVAAGLTLFVSPAQAQDYAVEQIEYRGDGCPQGSATAVLSPDGSALSVLFDQFQAQAGQGVPLDRKVCDIKVRIRKPKNMSFYVDTADFRGFVALDQGVKGLQKAWIGSGVGADFRMQASFVEQMWQGPLTQDFLLTSVRPETGTQLKSCIHKREKIVLHVRNVLRISKARREKTGMITVDSIDGKLVHRYNIRWFNCP